MAAPLRPESPVDDRCIGSLVAWRAGISSAMYRSGRRLNVTSLARAYSVGSFNFEELSLYLLPDCLLVL